MKEIDAVLDRLAVIVRELVQAIEHEPPTTKDRYDRYMAALTHIVTDQWGELAPKQMYLATSVAMIRAGANRQGVLAALKVMGKL